MATLSEVKTNITGRSKLNRFRVTLPTPEGVVSEVYVKASRFPGRTVEAKILNYRGAEIKYAGEPKYSDWSVTVYGEDYAEYEKFYAWMSKIGESINNSRGNPSEYKISSVKVDQIGLNNEVIATMYLEGVWPTQIGDINFDNDSTDMVTFEITFSVDATRFERIA